MKESAELKLDLAFGALADATRRHIVARLAKGEASVNELVAIGGGLSQPAITKHVHVLERAGLVSRSRDGQRRPVRLRAERLKEASAWLERYRAQVEETYERLDDYLNDLQSKERSHEPKQTRIRRRPR
ncbi:MAG TPA: metalloregulator ArsR/SmtB family transcription factor [Polyangiales bacterium]|nr:metalloregulator ArsR/SmtB family transcription factor [Polyangiales bacterium]